MESNKKHEIIIYRIIKYIKSGYRTKGIYVKDNEAYQK